MTQTSLIIEATKYGDEEVKELKQRQTIYNENVMNRIIDLGKYIEIGINWLEENFSFSRAIDDSISDSGYRERFPLSLPFGFLLFASSWPITEDGKNVHQRGALEGGDWCFVHWGCFSSTRWATGAMPCKPPHWYWPLIALVLGTLRDPIG